ncbi:MAG TPA: TetR/AcrR family transcriptional regulator, partial [Dietzia timorensis]|nr:TetR/AcrR family transcriptional regulator [Dietzia timorensis]
AYYLRTSVFENSPLDQAIIAATRLNSLPAERRREAFGKTQERWLELIAAEVEDPAIARAILLMGDGLYYNASLGSDDSTARNVEDLLGVVEKLKSVK